MTSHHLCAVEHLCRLSVAQLVVHSKAVAETDAHSLWPAEAVNLFRDKYYRSNRNNINVIQTFN